MLGKSLVKTHSSEKIILEIYHEILDEIMKEALQKNSPNSIIEIIFKEKLDVELNKFQYSENAKENTAIVSVCSDSCNSIFKEVINDFLKSCINEEFQGVSQFAIEEIPEQIISENLVSENPLISEKEIVSKAGICTPINYGLKWLLYLTISR